MRDDEHELMAAVAAGEAPVDAAARLNIPAPRARNLCDKWVDWGWFNRADGVLTEEGKDQLVAYETGGN
jgi:hypothetical protein